MKQPTLKERIQYNAIVENAVTRVQIEGTKKSVKLRWMHPYTIERITKVWIEREIATASVNNGAETLKDLCKEPYFAFKEAALMILNDYVKIRLFYGLYWRFLAWRYTEAQMVPIIAEGKKKLPLMPHYEAMAYSMDMRTDMMKMTKKEAEQYRVELLSAVKQLSSKTSRSTASRGESSDGGSVTGATVAS